MQFLIYKTSKPRPPVGFEHPYIALYQDNWNDHGWRCRFVATLHIDDDEEIDLGAVRIADDDIGFRASELPAILDKLPARAASLGESIAYYRRVGKLPTRLRKSYLNSLRDIVSKPERRARITDEDLWEKCFMREGSSRQALDRGGYYIDANYKELIAPKFRFSMQLPDAAGSHDLELNFTPHESLPNRMILLIGRNGTGKTRLLSSLAFAAMPPQVFSKETGKSMPEHNISPSPDLSRVITISYNAFDEFPLPLEPARAPKPRGASYRSRASYKYCGLRTAKGTVNTEEVGTMLAQALEPVAQSDRMDRLEEVLATLLDDQRAAALVSEDDETRNEAVAQLSAGQRLVTAIFSNIVGFIEEGSLLIIDEPETNLHPGLLSSVASALSHVLEEFDSYALVATHSPILLQQIPSRYVQVISRNNQDLPTITGLGFESFGEDLGELSRRVLGLTDIERDFSDVLDTLFEKHGSAEAVAKLFPFPLGIPAQSHLFALEVARDRRERQE
ncbi:ATP-binding protein [Rhizobium leguminosarum bv. trifolii]|nr:ATP-binding protein [Rhizobium leguminosarum bv. trifolii]